MRTRNGVLLLQRINTLCWSLCWKWAKQREREAEVCSSRLSEFRDCIKEFKTLKLTFCRFATSEVPCYGNRESYAKFKDIARERKFHAVLFLMRHCGTWNSLFCAFPSWWISWNKEFRRIFSMLCWFHPLLSFVHPSFRFLFCKNIGNKPCQGWSPSGLCVIIKHSKPRMVVVFDALNEQERRIENCSKVETLNSFFLWLPCTSFINSSASSIHRPRTGESCPRLKWRTLTEWCERQ